MVHHHHQHILALTDHQQLHPHRNLGGQIKTPTHHRRHGLPHPAGRPTAGIDNPPTQPHPLNRNNHLLRHPATALNTVRKLSCRPTTSAHAAPNAATSSRPRNRTAHAMW
ncbi:hypothetical protein NIIDMKKI_42830 [Mycobacterium kansasii]|uniref:Uncharacterized protein n=1 Tax=Mycobacterium kansasii TaxID=1768 RepID=A0A7G1IDR4_MYCKA|nr:hypothetical protein NIIDMKKI_42830 [Mycobacterium kansasii]